MSLSPVPAEWGDITRCGVRRRKEMLHREQTRNENIRFRALGSIFSTT